MRRTDRLFEILQMFRTGKLLLGRDIAERLEVSLRTVYRDIATLIASGIPIEGERGVGYILREPIFLPPLALTPGEFRALCLGVEIIRQTGDAEIADTAERLLGKVDAVSPPIARQGGQLDDISVYASLAVAPVDHLPVIRKAIAARNVLAIDYRSLSGTRSTRHIRPLQTEFWSRVWTCPAWCETRRAFRVFRIDRIETCQATGEIFEMEIGKRYVDYLSEVRERAKTAGTLSALPGSGRAAYEHSPH